MERRRLGEAALRFEGAYGLWRFLSNRLHSHDAPSFSSSSRSPHPTPPAPIRVSTDAVFGDHKCAREPRLESVHSRSPLFDGLPALAGSGPLLCDKLNPEAIASCLPLCLSSPFCVGFVFCRNIRVLYYQAVLDSACLQHVLAYLRGLRTHVPIALFSRRDVRRRHV